MNRQISVRWTAVLVMGLLSVIGVHAQQAGQQVVQRPEDISPLLYGEKIPQAALQDVSAKEVDLLETVATKPTVLVFYRGGWCPYCSLQLAGLQEAMPELEKLGYQLLAISTDSPEALRESAVKEKLGYTLLSDADLQVAKQFGIAYKAPEAYWSMLPKTTGGKNTDLLLPVPSVFIVDQTGVIQFEYINPDIKQRLSAALLLAAAGAIRDEG
ncbi:peroxiredoxin family protein [Parapedobacter pyrenivorans]|uniref:peroxiredoxin family protein n=1 Tax=Parapedobacter pyrenivorans TaxID=1305674 RepID=UPI00333F978F